MLLDESPDEQLPPSPELDQLRQAVLRAEADLRLDGVLGMWGCWRCWISLGFLLGSSTVIFVQSFRSHSLSCLCDSGLEAAGGSSELLEHVRAKLEELLGRDGVQSEHKLCTTYEIMRVYSILCLWAWHDLLDDIAFKNKLLWSVVLSSSR